MDASKIQLSAEEMQLVTNSAWILTKHRVIEKVYRIFGNVSEQMQLYIEKRQGLLPPQVLLLSPRITKGEQYEALPYVVLDYPRFFSKEDVFAIRCFFWWGHYFSITWHLKGKFQQQYQQKIAAAVAAGKFKQFYISTDGSEFSFHLEGKHYTAPGCKLPGNYNGGEHTGFLKISLKISFEHWKTAEQDLMQGFQRFIAMMED